MGFRQCSAVPKNGFKPQGRDNTTAMMVSYKSKLLQPQCSVCHSLSLIAQLIQIVSDLFDKGTAWIYATAVFP